MDNLFFSVVIPTYNRGHLIGRCLQSVINQSYGNWEAIVVDNYSNDNTEEVVRGFKDNRIKFYKNHNYGIISVSRNYAIERASGNWICFLDSDDYWDTIKLEELLSFVHKYDLIYHGFKTKSDSIPLFSVSKQMFYTVKESNVSYVLQRGDPFSPSCSAVSRAFLSETRFSENKEFFAIEDYDFFLQLLLKKPHIKHLKKYLTFYDSTTGISHDHTKHLDRSRVIYRKYQPYLSKREFRNVLRLYMLMRGIKYFGVDMSKARYYFKVASRSSAITFKAIKWILMTYTQQIFSKIKF